MDLDNQAAESGLDTGNAGGESSTPASAPEKSGLSLSESLAKAAKTVTERTADEAPARAEPADKKLTAFEPKAKAESGSLTVQDGSQGEAMAPSILEAPHHWPQKRKEAFAKFAASPDLQAVAKEWLGHTKELEGEFTRKAQEHAEYRKFTDTVRELFSPEQRTLLQRHGANEAQAIQHWAQLDTYARRDPAGYAKWFMQQTGLTPQQLFPELGQGQPNGQGNSADAEWMDPEIIKLREELGPLKSQLAQYQAQIQRQAQAAQAQQQAQAEETQRTIVRTIQQFAESKDDAGAPLYPYFSQVEDRMSWELSNNPEIKAIGDPQEMLKAAYDLAVWANPGTRQSMLDAQASAAQAEAAKRQAAEKARTAQTLKPRIGSVAGAAKAPAQDLKSMIRDAAGRARG
jgi:hypothetical protein